MGCALLERVGTRDMIRRAPITEYMKLSVLTMAGMYFTNWSLTYINYPMRILSKSSKVIPVMLVGVLLYGKYYTRLEYLSAFVLALGITLFTLGDAYDSPRFDVTGLLLISIGVFADAMTANFEEARLFGQYHCSQAEVLLFSNAFSSIWTLITVLSSNEFFDAVEHSKEHPEVITSTVMFATLGYSSSIFILLLIKRFGATNAEIVKSCRKVLSIVISFMAFGKTPGNLHWIGGAFFTLSVILGVHIKTLKMAAKREARKNKKDGVEEEEEYIGVNAA